MAIWPLDSFALGTEGAPVDQQAAGVGQAQGEIAGVECQWHVRPVADLAGPGRAAFQRGGEAQTVKADVFRVCHEVLAVAQQRANATPWTTPGQLRPSPMARQVGNTPPGPRASPRSALWKAGLAAVTPRYGVRL